MTCANKCGEFTFELGDFGTCRQPVGTQHLRYSRNVVVTYRLMPIGQHHTTNWLAAVNCKMGTALGGRCTWRIHPPTINVGSLGVGMMSRFLPSTCLTSS